MKDFLYGIVNSFHPRTLEMDPWFYGFLLGKYLQACVVIYIIRFIIWFFSKPKE